MTTALLDKRVNDFVSTERRLFIHAGIRGRCFR